MAVSVLEIKADGTAPEFLSSETVPLGRTSIDQSAQLSPCASIATGPASNRKPRNRQASVVIVDKSALYRAGLKHFLPSDRYRVVGDYATMEEISQNIFNNTHCILIATNNINDSLDNLKKLKIIGIINVIVLSDHQPNRGELFSMLAAGADSYLIKDDLTAENLSKTLDLVMLGGSVIPRGWIPAPRDGVTEGQAPSEESPASVVSAHGSCEGRQPSNSRLTEREQAILMRLTHGASNKHIARDLDIAEATVKVHVKSILRKLCVQNRTQAAIRAQQELRSVTKRDSTSSV